MNEVLQQELTVVIVLGLVVRQSERLAHKLEKVASELREVLSFQLNLIKNGYGKFFESVVTLLFLCCLRRLIRQRVVVV